MGIAFVPLYIKYLGSEAYGLIGVFAVLQAWLSLLNMGMTPTLSREMARFTAGEHSLQSIKDLLHSVFVLTAFFGGINIVLVYFLAPWLANSWLHFDKLSTDEVIYSISIMGFVVSLKLVEGLYQGVLVGLQKQVKFNIINAGMSTLRGGGAVLILALYSPTIYIFFIWQGLISIVTLITFVFITRHTLQAYNVKPKFSASALFAVRKFAGGMLLTTLLSLLLLTVDKIILSAMLSLTEFGYYTLAGTVAGALQQLVQPVNQAIYPRLASLVASGNHVAITSIFHRSSQLVSIIVIPSTCLLVFFGWDILYLWSGNSVLADSTAQFLTIMAIGNALHTFMYIPYSVQLAHGWTRLANQVNFVAVLLLVPLLLITVPKYGGIAAVWVWLGLTLSYVFISSYFFFAKLLPNERSRWFQEDIFLSAFIAIFVVGVAKLISFLWVKNGVGIFYLSIVFFVSSVACLLGVQWTREKVLVFFNRREFFQ